MRIRSQSDFWSGVLFIVAGVAIAMLAQDYRLGTAARMGPGYFPTLLGALLALLGALLALPAFLTAGVAVFLAAFSILIFVVLLGLPIRLWPGS